MFGDRRIIIRWCGVAVVVDAFFFCASLCRISCSSPVAFISFLAWCNFSVSVVPGYDYMRLPNVPCIPGPISGGLWNGWMDRGEAQYVNTRVHEVRGKEREGRWEGQRLRARPSEDAVEWGSGRRGMRRKDTRTGLCKCPIYGPIQRALAPAPHIYSIIYIHILFFVFNSRILYHFISRRTNFRLICKWNAHKQFFFLFLVTFFSFWVVLFLRYYFARSLLSLASFSGWRAVFIFAVPFRLCGDRLRRMRAIKCF